LNEVKKSEKVFLLTTISSNEIAVSVHLGLNPGSEVPAVPGHGVPVEDAHHLLHLLHQEVGSL
jgi:hypothetical protein